MTLTMHMRSASAAQISSKDVLPPRIPGVYRSFAKRGLDIGIVLLALVPVLLVMAPLCLLIMLDGHSPLYRQARIGRNGRVFRMWKLRSMVHDADARLEAHLAANPRARVEWDHAQKLRDDPRITPIGSLIRKTSLDELPQLFNVLMGDMSLVAQSLTPAISASCRC